MFFSKRDPDLAQAFALDMIAALFNNMGGNLRGYQGSETPETIRNLWQTPKPLFDNLNSEFNFVGDVAASDINHLCGKYLTAEQDALTVDWAKYFGKGYKWCNPPYDNVKPWIDKAAAERSVIMLVPADTSVKWFKEAVLTADEIRFINGRISFVRADTQEPQGGNNKGSVLIIWHPIKRFNCVMSMIDRDDLMTVH